MSINAARDATSVLLDSSAGQAKSVNQLMELVYDELRALAASRLKNESPGHTLSATALVNEAYMRLIEQSRVKWKDRAHFFAVAAQAIRRILIDHARAKKRDKRGGGAQPVALHEDAAKTFDRQIDYLALDDALVKLAALNARQARIVELRFFGGLSMDEIAQLLDASPRTVDGDWAMARAWLRRALRDDTSG